MLKAFRLGQAPGWLTGDTVGAAVAVAEGAGVAAVVVAAPVVDAAGVKR